MLGLNDQKRSVPAVICTTGNEAVMDTDRLVINDPPAWVPLQRQADARYTELRAEGMEPDEARKLVLVECSPTPLRYRLWQYLESLDSPKEVI